MTIGKKMRGHTLRYKAAGAPSAPLKGAASLSERLRAAGWRAAALAALYAASMAFVVPAVAYTLIQMKQGFLGLSEALTEYFPAHVVDGWAVLVGLPAWETPAAVAALAATSLFALVAVTILAPGEDGAEKQIFGPAASKTNELGSSRLYSDERLLLEITRTWDGSWEDGHGLPSGGGMVLGYSKAKRLFFVAPHEQHTFTFGMPGAGKTTAINYESIDCMVGAGDTNHPEKVVVGKGGKKFPVGSSVVISDPKGELYGATSGEIRERLYERYGEDRVHIIDFREPLRSESYNPMDHIWNTFERYKIDSDAHMEKALALLGKGSCTDVAHADRASSWTNETDREAYLAELRRGHALKVLAWSKAEDAALDLAAACIPEVPSSPGAHWETVARMALRSVILLVGTATDEDFDTDGEPITAPLPEQRTLESVHRLFEKYGRRPAKGQSPLVELIERLDPEHPAVSAIAQLRNSADKEYDTTVAEVIKFLDEYLGLAVNQIMNKSDFDLASFGTKQQVLYVVLPDDRPVVGKAFAILVTQMYQALVAKALETGKSLPVSVNFLMEEFGNLKVTIPDFANKLAMSRGYHIFFHIVLQGDKQLAERYGEHGLDDIIDKCGTRILLQTNDVGGVGKYFSDAMGVYTVSSASTSRHRKTLGLVDESANRSTREAQRPLMYPDEVCKWDPRWGALVLQQRPDREPTRKARRLGYRTMQPCVYPLVPAWETPTGVNLNIGDREQMQRKDAERQTENRIDERTPNVAWYPYDTFEERAATARSMREGALSAGAKSEMRRFARRREEEVEACMLLLGTDGVCGAGARLDDGEVAEILDQAKRAADRRQEFALNDYQSEDLEDTGYKEYASKVRSRTRAVKTAATRVLWRTAAEAMAKQDAGEALRVALEEGAGIRFSPRVDEEVAHDEGPKRKSAAECAAPDKVTKRKPEVKRDKSEGQKSREAKGPGKKNSIAESLDKEARETRTRTGKPRGKAKDSSWVGDVRTAAFACLEGAADMEEFKAGLACAGIELTKTSNGRDLLYRSAQGTVAGRNLATRLTKAMVENRFAGNPRKAQRRSLEDSMVKVLKHHGYDTGALVSEMGEKGLTFEGLVEEHPKLARWDGRLNRYECDWCCTLRVLMDEHGIQARKGAV